MYNADIIRATKEYYIDSDIVLLESLNDLGEIITHPLKAFSEFVKRSWEITKKENAVFFLQDEKDTVVSLLQRYPEFADDVVELRTYGDPSKKNPKETDMMMRNAVAIASYKDYPYVLEQYTKYTRGIAYGDYIIKIKLSEIPGIASKLIKDLKKDLKDTENSVKYIANAIRERDGNTQEKASTIKSICDTAMTAIATITKNTLDNISILRYFITERIKYALKVTKKRITATDDKVLMKNAIFMYDKSYNGDVYKIYKLKEEIGISSFNYSGKKIYITPNLFKAPKKILDAVIYHEIGHDQSNHFNKNEFRDARKELKQLRKDMRKYDSLLDVSPYRSDYYNDYKFLQYLLKELDADRFASKHVGKFAIRTATNTEVSRIMSQSQPDRTTRGFNMYNNDVRASLL